MYYILRKMEDTGKYHYKNDVYSILVKLKDIVPTIEYVNIFLDGTYARIKFYKNMFIYKVL